MESFLKESKAGKLKNLTYHDAIMYFDDTLILR